MYGGHHAGVMFTPPGPLVSALSYTLAKWGVQPIFYPEEAESTVFIGKIKFLIPKRSDFSSTSQVVPD